MENQATLPAYGTYRGPREKLKSLGEFKSACDSFENCAITGPLRVSMT
jgi:hypothetical protein